MTATGPQAPTDVRDRILLVDDDADIREMVAAYLERDQFDVVAVPDGCEMKARIQAGGQFDLIVLDLMLPGETGLELTRWLGGSALRGTPILMLTARADDVDRIIGLETGVDDYVAKPFVPRELSARIRAILRRWRGLPPERRNADFGRIVRFGTWRLDLIERCLISQDDVVTPLTSAEYGLLRFFVDHPLKVINRDTLIDRLLGVDSTPWDRAIDLRISRLRRRLEDDPRQPMYIRTIRNEGYIFMQQVVHEPAHPSARRW